MKKKQLIVVLCVVVVLVMGIAMAFKSISRTQEEISSEPVSSTMATTLSFKDIKEPDETEKTVTDYLIKKANKYTGEMQTAAVVIYGQKKKGDFTEVYAYGEMSGYGFEQGCFVDKSGCKLPMVFTLSKDGKVTEYKEPQDGSYYTSSIKKMFPMSMWENVLNPSEYDMQLLTVKCQKNAYEYLESFGRQDTKICSWGDVEHKILEDVGVPTIVANELASSSLSSDFYEYIGTCERIENGTRYLFTTSFDKNTNTITFLKQEYESKKIANKLVIDVQTGNEVKN